MAQTGGWLPGSLIQCITHSGLGWGRVIGATFYISCYYSVSTSFKFYVTQWGGGGGGGVSFHGKSVTKVYGSTLLAFSEGCGWGSNFQEKSVM